MKMIMNLNHGFLPKIFCEGESMIQFDDFIITVRGAEEYESTQRYLNEKAGTSISFNFEEVKYSKFADNLTLLPNANTTAQVDNKGGRPIKKEVNGGSRDYDN